MAPGRGGGTALVAALSVGLLSAGAAAHASAPVVKPGTGAQAVAHHAGGRVIDQASVVASAPSAQMYLTGHAAIEPSIGIDRSGSIFFNDDFAAGNDREVGVGAESSAGDASRVFSTRDGIHFTDVSPTIGSLYGHQESADPYLYVDPATGRIFDADLILQGSVVSFSDDQGRSWTSTVAGLYQADHETIFAGPPPKKGPKPSGYPTVVYYCTIAGGIASNTSTMALCSKSLDGGLTFAPTGAPAYMFDPTQCANEDSGCDGAVGHGYVGADGSIYLPKGYAGQPHLAVSHDEGATWTVVQVATNGMNTNAAGLDGRGFPDHEAAVVADATGTVYYLWVARNRLPYLAISHDAGRTWGLPLEIGAPGLTQADQPEMAIGATGKIATFYMGSTNAPAYDARNPSSPFPDDSTCATPTDVVQFVECPTPTAYNAVTWNAYITETADALAPDPTLYSVVVNDPSKPLVVGQCGPSRCNQEYDFEGIAVNPRDGTPWAIFVDGCAGQEYDDAGIPMSPPDNHGCGSIGEGALGHLVGGPSLT